MTEPTEPTGLRLRSQYDAATRSISIELLTGQHGLPGGARLALTSIVQLTPPRQSPVQLSRQVGTYQEFRLGDLALGAGNGIMIPALQLSHRPRHSNDGPLTRS